VVPKLTVSLPSARSALVKPAHVSDAVGVVSLDRMGQPHAGKPFHRIVVSDPDRPLQHLNPPMTTLTTLTAALVRVVRLDGGLCPGGMASLKTDGFGYDKQGRQNHG
jgi:hypothetical protein